MEPLGSPSSHQTASDRFRPLQRMSGRVNRDWFYKLASDLQEERVQAAVALIQELSALELPESAPEWSYVLKRLISGLSSSRNSARLGFSLCLTEVLNLALSSKGDLPAELITMDTFLDLLSETLALQSSGQDAKKQIKGKDERGLLFGKMFGLQALLSEPLFENVFITEEKGVSEFALRFVDELCQLAVVKTWLREPCLFTLYQACEKLLPYADLETVQSFLLVLDKYQLTLTNEGLAIYLLLLYKSPTNYSSVISQMTFDSKAWKSNDPLARGNLPVLSQVLRDSSVTEDEQSPKASNWTPRLHFVWDILLPIIAQDKSKKKADDHAGKPKTKKRKKEKASAIEFPEFWQMAVDESMFNEKASTERKFLGFIIFQKVLEAVPHEWVECCFSQNLMRTLINHASDSKRLLFKISHRVLQSIVDVCQEASREKLVPCLNAILFGPHGSINFDKLTKSKTVSNLLTVSDLDENTLNELFGILSSKLNESSLSEHKAQLQFVLDTMLHAVRGHKSELKSEIITNSILRPVISLAFFSDKDEHATNLAKERFYSLLSEITHLNDGGHSYQNVALRLICEAEDTGRELTTKLDDTLKNVKDEALKTLRSISSNEQNPQSRGLEMIISMCLLQLYSGESEAVSVIEELCEFYQERDENNNSLVGITEILLSLLAQKKAVLRKLSLYAWQQFVSEIGDEELKALLDVLPARENKKGFRQLFEGADEYELDGQVDDDGAGEDDEESDEEAEEESDLESGKDDDTSDELANSGEENATPNRDDVAKIDKEATSALAKALNLPDDIVNEKGEVDLDNWDDEDGDDVADGEEDDEDDEESMDDEKMMELDDQLSQIFKRRKDALSNISTGNQRKIEAKESREDVVAFKQRVVDMLEIYVKFVEKQAARNENTNVSSCLLLIEPMIKCIQQTTDKSLANRAAKLLKTKLFKIKTNAFQQSFDQDELMAMMKKTHESLLTSKPGQHQATYYSVCGTASLFLAKIIVECSVGSKEAAVHKIIDLYADTMKLWATAGKFGPNLFIDFSNWLSSRK